MTDEIKRWFVERVAQDPEYLNTHYLPALERLCAKSEYARDQANRTGTIDEIKYRMGWLDGVRETCAILDGLKKSRGEQPAEPGLMARMFGPRS